MKFAATLPAADVERAKNWYAAILDLKPSRVDDNGNCWYESEGTMLLVYESQFAGTNKATAVGLEVDDVVATVAELKERGAVFEEYDFGEDFRTEDSIFTTPDGTTLAWLKDSEGNILGLAPPPA